VPVNFIKRLIGAPGDVLVVHRGQVIINGTSYGHTSVREALASSGYFKEDPSDEGPGDHDLQADHHVKFTSDGVFADGKLVPNSELARILTEQPSDPVRVIPGETILNGKVLAEPFTAEDPDYDLRIYKGESLKNDPQGGMRLDGQQISKEEYDADMASPAEPVPSHKYFMMGDNRNDSKDSTEWGPLDEDRIVGRAQVIFWPLNRIRMIH
jgi:signal peptidase I